MNNRLLLLFIVVIVTSLFKENRVYGQDMAIGIANDLKIQEDVFNGALVCSQPEGFKLCNTPYSEDMFGVNVDKAIAVMSEDGNRQSNNVLTSGTAVIRINQSNGQIEQGDYVTSSDQPGLAMKATANGYVLGVAVEDQTSGLEPTVKAVINIHTETSLETSPSNLIAVLREASNAPVLAPLAAWRYLIAAMMVVISFMLGFIYFGKTARAGVEAVGRNPLAEKMIRRNVFFNMLVTVMIVGGGLLCAYFVLVL